MHKRMKSGVALGLVAVAGLALSGCSSSSKAADSHTITILAESKQGMTQLVAAYEKKYPDDHVQVSYATTVDSYQQQARTQLSAGTAADIVRIWPGSGAPMSVGDVSKSHMAMDLSNEPWVKDMTPDEKATMTDSDGKVLAMPATVASIGPIYNQTVMNKVGLTAPTKWSEVEPFCKAAKSKGEVAYALGMKNADVTQLIPYALSATLVYGKDPNFVKDMADGKTTFADSAWKDVFDNYLKMNDWGCFNPSPNGTSFDEASKMVSTGKALGVVAVNAASPGLVQQAPEGTEFKVVPLPATDNPADTHMPVAVGASYGINAKAKNPEGAKRFLEFWASDEGQSIYATNYGAVPALPSDSYKASEVDAPTVAAMQAGTGVTFPDQLWPNPQIQQDLYAGVQEMFNGTTTPDAVLKKMDADYKAS